MCARGGACLPCDPPAGSIAGARAGGEGFHVSRDGRQQIQAALQGLASGYQAAFAPIDCP
jgi:hypothetical protein